MLGHSVQIFSNRQLLRLGELDAMQMNRNTVLLNPQMENEKEKTQIQPTDVNIDVFNASSTTLDKRNSIFEASFQKFWDDRGRLERSLAQSHLEPP